LLFRDPSVDGLKTGHTEAAGYCLIATARDFANPTPTGGRGPAPGRRLLSIVLGTASENARANESQKLLNWGYTAFEASSLFDANQAWPRRRSGRARPAAVKLGRPQPLWWPCRRAMQASIKTQVVRLSRWWRLFAKGQP
jgi:D-alanyl-D-alanine carboxypeptidase (penicillin-binding protein 5/6)